MFEGGAGLEQVSVEEAASELAESARVLDSTPGGLKMRFLQTLAVVAEHGNTTVFSALEGGESTLAMSSGSGAPPG